MGATEKLDRSEIVAICYQICSLLKSLGWAGAFVFCCYFLQGTAIALAGHKTELMVSFLLSFFADMKGIFSVSIPGVAILWACWERQLRKSTIKRLTARIQKFENGIDPSRSSSGLTPTGSTHPRDKEK